MNNDFFPPVWKGVCVLGEMILQERGDLVLWNRKY